MRTVTIFMMIAIALAGSAWAQTTLHVAPNGNDAWTGAAERNEEGTDGPLATLAGARDRIRALRAGGALAAPVRVVLRGGSYPVTEPVVFGPEDSGTKDLPVRYEAAPGEQPAIHGGRILSGWREEGNLWAVDIPEVRDGKWYFESLWVNGERRQPARTPNPAHAWGDEPEDSDTFHIAEYLRENDPDTGKEIPSKTRFKYAGDDLKPWANPEDAVVLVYHSWETSRHRIKNLDEANRVVEFTGPAVWHFGYWGGTPQRYYVENIFEALDQPGEWYLNRKTGVLYYMPMPGEDMRTAEVVAPVARQLLTIEGKPDEGRFVDYLTFAGIRFLYTDCPLEPQGHSDGQAAASIHAAVQATGARFCAFERCDVMHVSNYGVWFRAGCQDNLLTRCEIADLGAGGVRIGECGDPPNDAGAALRNVVDNNFIHDGGKIFRGAVGVWIGRSSYNRISHNDISDFRYTGISVGWSWGYAASSANHNIIEYNDVHHIGHGQLGDMGGIYLLGVAPGTVIQFNKFHDVMSFAKGYGGWGIYFDEGSTDLLAENNIVYNTLTGTFHQHYGRDNRVQNNIFAFSHGPQIIRSRPEDHKSFFFERNIVLFNNGQLLGSNWGNNNFYLDKNCYWDMSGDDFDFAGHDFDEWKALGHDVHSIIADPLFENAAALDFRLKPGSPALAMGFVPIDLSLTGLYGEPEWTSKPSRVVREPFPMPKPPEPTAISQDFEGVETGTKTPGVSTNEEGAGTARVTDETAASGKHSLKFTDAPGLAHGFNPHVYYSPAIISGTVKGRFALRVEPGAVVFHEWRDHCNPYRVGPSLWIDGQGDLKAGGKTLATIPHGQWFFLEITCPLGKAANGMFTLTITLPGQTPQSFDGLACGHPAFRRLDWFGFVSNTNGASTFYLDDVTIAADKPQAGG
ncbi:MAG TPA: right-handed parallel beta-helix repeat-containing protein [Candidatus Hydrogenedentes bacterium]|nr:right-handed parallel beta-helix repeat-containing protein [Candidatus Hydrogenedentota bacterium]HPC17618.1 right-handed parallel beta-helix repeat-containing protein [Candidatus Hydrogenedentota bacterium]HRT21536.1 right-handed parallel beta-helix repeat-containing protein [Candidatus Hydrogenedentota bacterium]HRT65987.1 right-handed parallel beta-helix repeat-containing protein [Candidatus Hydrogenedentota bacterium]